LTIFDPRLIIEEVTDREFFLVSKALADPQRFDIYRRIAAAGAGKELACKALTEALDVSPATISHHTKELANANLIESRKGGQCLWLRANRRTLAAWQAELRRRVGK
jgi:ArsR family transcriptional regulator